MQTPRHTPIQSSVIGSDLDAKLFHTYARLVMAAWKHDFQYTDWLSQDEMERMVGLDWSNIKRHTAELRRAGLIDWKTHGKNDRRFFIVQVRLEDGAKAQYCAPSSSNSINTLSTEMTPTTSEGARLRPGINVDAVIDQESLALLRGLGLGEPRRSRVADLPGCTPHAIRAHAARMREEGHTFPSDVALLAWRIEMDWPVPPMCEMCGALDGEHTESCPTQVERVAQETERKAEQARQDETECRARVQANADVTIHCQNGRDYTAIHVLDLALDELRLQLTSSTFNMWLGRAGLAKYDQDGAMFVVGVHNEFARDWLQNRMIHMFNRTLTSIIGIPTETRFVVWGGRR